MSVPKEDGEKILNVSLTMDIHPWEDKEHANYVFFAATFIEDPNSKQISGPNWEDVTIRLHRHALTLEDITTRNYAGFKVFWDVEDVRDQLLP